MRAHLRADAPVHVHCFTSSANWPLLAAPGLCLDCGLVVNNGGDVREVVAGVPLDRILLETDTPYMAPTPFRGQTSSGHGSAHRRPPTSSLQAFPSSSLAACRATPSRLRHLVRVRVLVHGTS